MSSGFNRILLLYCVVVGIGVPDEARAEDIPGEVTARARIEPSLARLAKTESRFEVMVQLRRPAHVSPIVLEIWQTRIRTTQEEALACAGLSAASVMHKYRTIPMLHLTLTPAQLLRLSSCSSVEAIGRNHSYYPQLKESIPHIRAREGEAAVGANGDGATVAIIDTGVDYLHEQLGGCIGPGCRVVAGYDFGDGDEDPMDCNGHGTNVAAIAAGARVIPEGCESDCLSCIDDMDVWDCSPGGVAPGAQIIALKVFGEFNDCATATDALIADAMDWVVANRTTYNIVSTNVSLGSESPRFSMTCDDVVRFTAAANTLYSTGVLVVTSAGNDGEALNVGYPGCLSRVMSVANSYDTYDELHPSSNGGRLVEVAAPGAYITAAGMTMLGTSQASPHVAGAAAALMSAFPETDVESLRYALHVSDAYVEDARSGVEVYQYPRLDVYSALAALPDADGDGYPPEEDCDNANPDTYPGAPERCNATDDDCDGIRDEGFDQDGDGYATCGGDCDDTDASVYPFAEDIGDEKDNDCDDLVDEDVPFERDYSGGCACGIPGAHGGSREGEGAALLLVGMVMALLRLQPPP